MAYVVRLTTFKILRWPHTSGKSNNNIAPLSLIPQLIGGGIFFSLVDVLRRVGIEEALKIE